MDIEPTLMEIAARKGPDWAPRKLDYFDEPIWEAFQARVQGRPGGRSGEKKRFQDYTEEEVNKLIADTFAEQDAERARSKAEG